MAILHIHPPILQHSAKIYQKSKKLNNVCYDIRGPALERAKQLEEEGLRVIKLNIGNLKPFGFDVPEEMMHDVVLNLPQASAYSDSKGLFAARKAVMQYAQTKKIKGVQLDNIILGNGVSELIGICMQGLLDEGDEVLIPAPDYPLWTASVSLAGGKAIHYICDEASDWLPDLVDIEKKITPRTQALLIINPNNPTGALYPESFLLQLVEIARKHDLLIFSDEIYDRTVYDGHKHTAIASLADDVPCFTLGGLSKNYRACGYRAGWLIMSGDLRQAKDYIDGLNILATMRLCANLPGQFAIQTALGGYQSIDDLVAPQGRLTRQRNLCYKLLTEIPGISCVNPQAALYMFPKIDLRRYPIENDQHFILQLLEHTHVLVVQGSGFHWPRPDHLRITFLPSEDELRDAMQRIAKFFEHFALLPTA